MKDSELPLTTNPKFKTQNSKLYMANFITSKIPNTLTCGNLVSGCIATLFALCGEAQLALVWIIAGAVFDFFDGMSARLLGVSSPIGKELDSLAWHRQQWFSHNFRLWIIRRLWILSRHTCHSLPSLWLPSRHCDWQNSILTHDRQRHSLACPHQPTRCSGLRCLCRNQTFWRVLQ